MPTPENEIKDLQPADSIYDSCGDYLRARTRNKENFPLIFEENVNYGFRRNLWRMKVLGINLAIVSILLISVQIHPNWLKLGVVNPIALIALFLDVSFLIIWFTVITTDWIKTDADAYDKQLLGAIDMLDSRKPQDDELKIRLKEESIAEFGGHITNLYFLIRKGLEI